MAGRLDEISRVLGSIETSIKELSGRAAEDRRERDREHVQNQKAIAGLSAALADRAQKFDDYTQRTDGRLSALEMLQPIVTGLQMTRAKLTTLASIGFAVVVIVGWMFEAVIKWAVSWALSHWH